MTAKKLPLSPAFGLVFLWFAVYVVGQFWRPTEMTTVTYHLLVNNALVLLGAVFCVYVICYCLWLRHYHEERREVLANLAAANKYIYGGIVSQRCLNVNEAEEHVLIARRWSRHDDVVMTQTKRRYSMEKSAA